MFRITSLRALASRKGPKANQSSLHWIAALLTLLAMTVSNPAAAAGSFALYGEVKYKPGFEHFDYVNPNAPKGGTIKLAYTAPFDSTNPFILKGIAAPGISNFLYQTLMAQSYDEPQSFYPLIAKDIVISADERHFTLTLDDRAKWHNGSPITSEDVIFTLNALKEKGHPQYRVLYKPISVKSLGTHRVQFTIDGTPQREQRLLIASMPVLPKKYFDHVPFDKTTLKPPMGSGPYKIVSIDPGRTITFERVKDYWAANLPSQKGFYNFDRIQIDVYRDDVASSEGIKSHQFDYFEEFIARNWATAYNVPVVKSGQLIKTLIPHKIPRGMQGFIFNTRLDKFSDRRVREAIGLTLDFEWMNKTLFYGAYERNSSYFNNTEFAAPPLPTPEELKLLEPFRCKSPPPLGGRKGGGHKDTHSVPLRPLPSPPLKGEEENCLPESVFTTEYKVPRTDGTGYARGNMIRAQELLNEAGWVMKGGKRVNAKTGEPMVIEFLMTQRTFERVIGIMRQNLKKLGIDSSFRYVDASQYQKRLDAHQFDIVSIWWNQGTFYPGQEQFTYWHSSQADMQGATNRGGIKNKAVDDLVERIAHAKDLSQLIPAGRALDRVLLHEYYVIPHWNINGWRILYWDQFGRPKITPAYNIGIDTWWSKSAESKGTKQ